MKKIIVILLVIIAVVVLAVGAGAYILYSKKDELVRRGTEKGLTFALMTDCTVGAAKLDIGAGTIEFTDIVLGNPSGYESPHAMKFGTVRVEADIQSFRTQEPTINLVQISQADIVLEKNMKSSNLQDLMANAGRFSSGEEAPPPPDDPNAKAMKIKKVLVDGTTVNVALPLAGGKTIGVEVPTIEMEDIGGKKEKVTPAEALQQFIAEILASVTKAGSGLLPTDLLDSIGGSLENLPGDIKGQIDGILGGEGLGDVGKDLEDAAGSVTGEAEKAGKEIEGAVKDVTGSIGGLFGGKKDE
ncbi:MAG: hypothetical protein PWP23_1663 [Candidatus Sumerlaeota bacterium]|nr:hypothetical protein [Candidatus Sumerlaeota bacterium]